MCISADESEKTKQKSAICLANTINKAKESIMEAIIILVNYFFTKSVTQSNLKLSFASKTEALMGYEAAVGGYLAWVKNDPVRVTLREQFEEGAWHPSDVVRYIKDMPGELQNSIKHAAHCGHLNNTQPLILVKKA